MIKVIQNVAILGQNTSGIKRLSIVDIDGKKYWDIQKTYIDADGTEKMTKNGITLNYEQTIILKDALDDIMG